MTATYVGHQPDLLGPLKLVQHMTSFNFHSQVESNMNENNGN